MIKKENNYAYIDGANLHNGIAGFGWKLNYARFKVWLSEKYGVKNAYIFIGLAPKYKELCKYLQECGFTLVFKEVIYDNNGKAKGNYDAELVLQAMIEYKNYDKAVIITGDGDFHCLVKYFIEQNKLKTILVPNKFKFSALLKFKTFRPFLRYVNDLKEKVAYKKKRPHKDETL